MKKILFDFFPIILFFIAYKFYGFYLATIVAIVATILQNGLYWLRHRSLEKSQIITLVLIVVFGGASVLLENELIFKWKPTVINWLFAIAFLASHWIGKKTIIERMLGKNMTLPAPTWAKLNLSWSIFFITLGFINLYVVYNYDTDTWVNFKLYGLIGITVFFSLAQALYLSKQLERTSQ